MSTQSSLLVAALLLVSLALGNADLYANAPAPPPPFKVAGKEFPPETTFCNDPTSRCFGKLLSCPQQCPQFKPADPKAKGCFLDCNRPSCESGTCLNRKPNCDGNGAACYDPRFVGGDGIMFYFHGKAGRHFALVSDTDFQINARFIGIRPAGRPRDFTWIQSLGVLFGPHSFTLAASPTASWDSTADHLAFSYDGIPLHLEEGHLSSWTSPAGLTLERTARVNSVTVTIPRVFEIKATVVPVTEEDNRVHKYGIPEGDCFAHLEVQFKFFRLSEKVEGVLGQTYRPGFESPVKRGVSMPIMGGEDRFGTDSLLSPRCRQCLFALEMKAEDNVETGPPALATLDCTSKLSNYGVVCRR